MPDSETPKPETEDDILARIETALQKIAAVGKAKPAPPTASSAGGPHRDKLAAALDTIIGRLRNGLEPPGQEIAASHHTE